MGMPSVGVWLGVVTVIAIAALGIAVLALVELRALGTQLDDVDDNADRAGRAADDAVLAAADAISSCHRIVDHLEHTDPPSTGRHAHHLDDAPA